LCSVDEYSIVRQSFGKGIVHDDHSTVLLPASILALATGAADRLIAKARKAVVSQNVYVITRLVDISNVLTNQPEVNVATEYIPVRAPCRKNLPICPPEWDRQKS